MWCHRLPPLPRIVEQQDDGFELFESRAIGRYIATLGSGPELLPTDPKARAKFEQAASVEYSHFEPIASGILVERVFKQYRGLTADEERVKQLIPQLESKLDVYETILGKQKYLAGDVGFARLACEKKSSILMDYLVQEVTLADLFHLPHGSLVFEHLGLGNLETRPNVQR
jgi:glutathione S-transferase